MKPVGESSRERRQLALIGEVADLAVGAGVELWLRGGWALDFFLGRVTRSHGDIDFFMWVEDAPAFSRLLRGHGFGELGGVPPEQQRNFVKAGEEIHVGLLRRKPSGEVVVAGGPSEGAPWPDGMLGSHVGRIGERSCRIISPESQLEIKEKFPAWTGRPAREWDPADIELLRAALGR